MRRHVELAGRALDERDAEMLLEPRDVHSFNRKEIEMVKVGIVMEARAPDATLRRLAKHDAEGLNRS